MYVSAVAAIMATEGKAMHGPGFSSLDTILGYEIGTVSEGSAIEGQAFGYSYGESGRLRNITSLLEEQLTHQQIRHEGSSSSINDTQEGRAELNDISAFQSGYVTNTEQTAKTVSDNEYTRHIYGYQQVPANVTEKLNLQRGVMSENPRKFGSSSWNVTEPVKENSQHDNISDLPHTDTTNITISTQESTQMKTATVPYQGIIPNRPNNTNQTNVKRKVLETLESSTDHGAANIEGTFTLLNDEEDAFNETLESAWSYADHFLSSGDLQVGQKAIDLMQQYVEDRRRRVRHMEFIASHNSSVSDELLSYGPSLWVRVRRLNEVESTLHNLQEIYRLATIVKHNETGLRNYSETHNNSAELSFAQEAEKYLNDLEILIRDVENVCQYYFVFPWNCSLQLVVDTEYLRARNESIHQIYFLAHKKKELEHIFEYYVYPTFYFVILVLGATGNGALLLMFAKYKDIRTAPNIMVFNLAVVDILNMFVNTPLYYVSKYHSQWLFLGGYGCRIFATFRFLNHSVIEFSIVGMSLQRYCAAVTTMRNPTSQWRLSARWKTVRFVVVVWLISLAVSLPPSLVYEFPNGVCFPLATALTKALNVFYFVIYVFVLPVTLGVFSAITARKLKQSVRNIPGELRHRSQEISRYRSARVVTALAISYVITHIPRSVWFFCVSVFHLDRMDMKYIFIDEVTNYLIFANSCINPLALYISSGKFRQLFKRHLFCLRQDEKQCSPLERQVTASSSTKVVFLIESYADLAGHKTSLKELNNLTKQINGDVNTNPNT
jgi:hypothetical protein